MDKKLIAGIIIIAILVGGILVYTFGGDIPVSREGNVSITDAAGRTVQVPAQVNKVVGTGCSGREIVYLNASDKMVGIEQMESNSTGAWGNQLPYMIAHPELLKLPVVANARTDTVYYEKLAEVDPDVVFVGTAEQADNVQTKTGIPAVVVYVGAVETPEQMDKYKESLKMMGRVLGKEDRADELINYINSYEEDLAKRTAGVSSNKTVYIAGQAYYGTHGITSTNAFYPPFIMVNADNVASAMNTTTNATLHAISVDKEQLVTWNPDMIFVEGSSAESIINDTNQNTVYQSINAVKNGDVYDVLPYCLFSYNKDSMIADAYYIGKILYPEQFADVDPEEKANEIFMKFNGGSGELVYSTLKTQYGGFKKMDI
jgi:iron complex transport system substrate-binding protein